MKYKNNQTYIIVLCAFAVVVNGVLGSVIGYLNIPLLFLDTIGTVYIALNYDLRYGVLTAIGSSLLTAVFHGPVVLPFGLVSIAIAIIAHLFSKSAFTYKRAVLAGILMAFIGSLISTPIRLVLYGGLSNSISDFVVFSLKASGRTMLASAYWGTVTDNMLDKIITCLLVAWLSKISQLRKFKVNR